MAIPLTVTLDEEALGALESMAKRTGNSRDWLVSRAVEAFASYDAWKIGKIEEGVAAADRGDFASEKDVARVQAKFP